MINGSLLSLITPIIQQTEASKFKWSNTSKELGFVLTFDNYSLYIEANQDLGIITGYSLGLIDKSGNFIEKSSITPLENIQQFNLIGNLYEKAKNSARNIDKAIDEIRKYLR